MLSRKPKDQYLSGRDVRLVSDCAAIDSKSDPAAERSRTYTTVNSHKDLVAIANAEGVPVDDIPRLFVETCFNKLPILLAGLFATVHSYIIFVAAVFRSD